MPPHPNSEDGRFCLRARPVHLLGFDPHAGGVQSDDPAGWREHFGQEYQRLRAAKHIYDPQNLLTPGYEVFTRPDDERP